MEESLKEFWVCNFFNKFKLMNVLIEMEREEIRKKLD